MVCFPSGNHKRLFYLFFFSDVRQGFVCWGLYAEQTGFPVIISDVLCDVSPADVNRGVSALERFKNSSSAWEGQMFGLLLPWQKTFVKLNRRIVLSFIGLERENKANLTWEGKRLIVNWIHTNRAGAQIVSDDLSHDLIILWGSSPALDSACPAD